MTPSSFGSWFTLVLGASKLTMSSQQSESASTAAAKCPVDHSSRQAWADLPHPPTSALASSSSHTDPVNPHSSVSTAPHSLSKSREISSIPRTDSKERWVYPSEAQFYNAMERKNHSPQAKDMRVIVPIHNAVNERTWMEVLAWEAGRGGNACGGIRLVSFKGDASKLTPKARWKMLFGSAFL